MAIATKPSFIPTLNKKPAAPVAAAPVAPVAPVAAAPVAAQEGEVMTEVETPVEAPAATKATRKSSGKPRQTPNRQMVKEDIDFILANVKTMSYTQMAEERGITKHQVNRVLMTVKKDLRTSAGEDAAKLALVDQYILENLSRPEDSRPGKGGAGRGSAVKDSIDDIVGNLLNSIIK